MRKIDKLVAEGGAVVGGWFLAQLHGTQSVLVDAVNNLELLGNIPDNS